MAKGKKKTLFIGLAIGAVVLAAMIAIVVIPVIKNNVYRLITIESITGSVALTRDEKDVDIFDGMHLKSEDRVETAEASKVLLLADEDKHILAEENTGFSIEATGNAKKGAVTICLEYGSALITVDNKLEEGASFEVNTPNAALSIRGTTFRVTYDTVLMCTVVDVLEGVVEIATSTEVINVNAGESYCVEGTTISSNKIAVWPIYAATEADLAAGGPEQLELLPDTWIVTVIVGESGIVAPIGDLYQGDENAIVMRPDEGYQITKVESYTIEMGEIKYAEEHGTEVSEFIVPDSGVHYIYCYFAPEGGNETSTNSADGSFAAPLGDIEGEARLTPITLTQAEFEENYVEEYITLTAENCAEYFEVIQDGETYYFTLKPGYTAYDSGFIVVLNNGESHAVTGIGASREIFQTTDEATASAWMDGYNASGTIVKYNFTDDMWCLVGDEFYLVLIEMSDGTTASIKR